MDKQEFTRRVVGCEQKLFRVAYLTLGGYQSCEDAVQETLVKAWVGRGSLRNPQYFETWLIRILINVCRSLQRKARPACHLSENLKLPDPEDAALRDALAALPPKYRAAIVLHHLAGYPVKEVAAILHTTSGVVRWRLEQGKRKLKELLTDGEGSI